VEVDVLRLRVLALLFAAAVSQSRISAEELTPEQRKIADALVAERISEIRAKIINKAKLKESISELSQRKKGHPAWEQARRIASCVGGCRRAHVAVPEVITDEVVDDIIWQYDNTSHYDKARGRTSRDEKNHRRACAGALAAIGNPKGTATILRSLEREGGYFTWPSLGRIPDERFIAAIEKNFDLSSHQSAFPAIACFEGIGVASIPTLRRFVEGKDRSLRSRAVEALIKIGSPRCIPILKPVAESGKGGLAAEARAGILRIRRRTRDGVYAKPVLPPEDESRLWYLTLQALGSYGDKDKEARTRAADALVRIGQPSVLFLRPGLASYAHIDYKGYFYISDRAAKILVRIGEPAIPCLIDGLCDRYGHARRHAAEALGRITGEALGPDYEAWVAWLRRQEQERSRSGVPVTPPEPR
jgi:hypothetical protein